MAQLIGDTNTIMSQLTGPSPPSPNLQVPHVFVIPPEEEQQDNPPWCCFDADEQPEDNDDPLFDSDIHFLDAPYPCQQSEDKMSELLPRRTSTRQPRPRILIPKKLEKKQRPEAIKIIENKSSQARQRDLRRDSDVIEIVKVKRCREALPDLEESTRIKRSKTLKARATEALRSIKNVGRTSHRTHVKEIWASTEGMPGSSKGMQEQIRSQEPHTEGHPPKEGSLSRGNSRSLSRIFQSAKSSQAESQITACVAPSGAPIETHHILPAANSSSLSRPRHSNMNPALNEVPSTPMTDDASNRPVSPIPTMKKNARRKFSIRELHRLFSFSSSSAIVTTAPFSSAYNCSEPSPSTLSHDHADVLMEEDIDADAYFIDLESSDRMSVSQDHHTHHDDDLSTPHHFSDLSFEMQLDSLHFDALSFNPEDFDMSREGDVLR